MVFDLLSCYEMGTAYPTELAAVNFPKAQLDQAKSLHIKLCSLIAKSTLLPDEEKQFRDLRNRAYTWLRQAIDEMRVFGVWLHADNPEKAANYISKYHHDMGKIGATKFWSEQKEQTVPPTVMAE